MIESFKDTNSNSTINPNKSQEETKEEFRQPRGNCHRGDAAVEAQPKSLQKEALMLGVETREEADSTDSVGAAQIQIDLRLARHARFVRVEGRALVAVDHTCCLLIGQKRPRVGTERVPLYQRNIDAAPAP